MFAPKSITTFFRSSGNSSPFRNLIASIISSVFPIVYPNGWFMSVNMYVVSLFASFPILTICSANFFASSFVFMNAPFP